MKVRVGDKVVVTYPNQARSVGSVVMITQHGRINVFVDGRSVQFSKDGRQHNGESRISVATPEQLQKVESDKTRLTLDRYFYVYGTSKLDDDQIQAIDKVVFGA